MNKLIGVIGGSGLDNPELFLPESESFPETPFGKPSSPLRTGVLKGSDTRIVLLARHGLEHTIPPHRVNYRANVYDYYITREQGTFDIAQRVDTMISNLKAQGIDKYMSFV